MLEVLLTVVPSLCWLLLRCYRLLQTPAEKLIRQLNVEIPAPPVVCVDALGSTHITFHWTGAVGVDQNIFYAVMVNGKDVATLARTLARLSGLCSDTVYSIQVLAVNVVSNFISQLAPVYVHTATGTSAPVIPQLTKTLQLQKTPPEHTPEDSHPRATLTEIAAMDITQLEDEHTLVAYLGVMQREVTRAARDHETQITAQMEEEQRLRGELVARRRQLGSSSDGRGKKDLDFRDLERQKDQLTFTRLKLVKQLRTLEAARSLSNSRLADLRGRVSKLSERRHQVDHALATERERADHTMTALHEDIAATRLECTRVENTIKELVAEKRALGSVAAQLRSLVHPTTGCNPGDESSGSSNAGSNADMFSRDGTLTKAGAQVMLRVYLLRPDWEPELAREIEILHGLAALWQDTFCDALATYVSLYTQVEAARASRTPGYEPQRMTEHQASVKFAGFLLALPRGSGIRKKAQILNVEDSLSPSPQPPENGLLSFYSLADGVGAEPAALTPQSLNALMVALHQFASSGSGGNARVLLDHGSSIHEPHLLALPNLSFADYDHRDTDDQAPSWLHQQSYPGLNTTPYANLNLDTAAIRSQAMPYANDTLLYGTGANFAAHSAAQPTQDLNQSFDQSLSQSVGQNLGQSVVLNVGQSMSANIGRNITPTGGHALPLLYLGGFQEPVMFTPDIQQPTPKSAMQHYAQNIRQNFPYDEPLYHPSPGPLSEQQYLSTTLPQAPHGLSNTLWNNTSQSSFLDQRRPFQEYSQQPQMAAESLHPSVSQHSNLSSDSGLLNGILLPSTSHFSSTNSIWLDRYTGGNYGHNRAVSTGSNLWRNEGARGEKSPVSGFVSEFLPFSLNTFPSQNGSCEPQDQPDYDIRLM